MNFNTRTILQNYREETDRQWPPFQYLLDRSVSASPEKIFLTSYSPQLETFTYREVDMLSRNAAVHLRHLGIQKGDSVVISGKNSPQWAILFFSVLRISAVAVPIDFQLENERILHLAAFSDARAVFIDTEKIDLFADSFPLTFPLDTLTDVFCSIPGDAGASEAADALDNALADVPLEDDTAAILFTSGTTGNEKGVMLSHKNIVSNIFMAGDPDFISGIPEDVYYALLPLHHSYTMTVCLGETVLHGASLIFAKRIVTSQIMKDLKRGKVTMFIGIPLLYNKILKALMKEVRSHGLAVHLLVGLGMRISGFCKQHFAVNPGRLLFRGILRKIGFSHLRAAICGGGPLSDETFRRYNELGVNFVQGYGLTETAPIITLNPKHAYNYRSVGKPLPYIDLKIVDPDEAGKGEVAVKGPNVTSGYYKNPEETEALFTDDGYLLTGDVGYLNRRGYLFLTGRKKSLIVTEGGKNVYPEEIEEYFQLYQQISQILVKGYIPDRKSKAEYIEAVIYPDIDHYREKGIIHSTESLTDDEKKLIEKNMHEIIDHVNSKLLPYQRISRVTVIDFAMETTNTQKIKRNAAISQLRNMIGFRRQ